MSGEFRNRFRDPGAKPQWAELTRWAGDHASILFEDLRRRMSVIEGLQEALHFAGPEIGWVPRYRVGDVVLLDVHLSPGVLESTVYVEAGLREKLLSSRGVAAGMKEAFRDTPPAAEMTVHRFRLTNASSVRSLARLVRLKGQLVTRRP